MCFPNRQQLAESLDAGRYGRAAQRHSVLLCCTHPSVAEINRSCPKKRRVDNLVVPVCPDRSGISYDRIRQGADRQPRIGSDDINLGLAGVLQEFREAGLAGDEYNVVSCGRCVARSQVHQLPLSRSCQFEVVVIDNIWQHSLSRLCGLS